MNSPPPHAPRQGNQVPPYLPAVTTSPFFFWFVPVSPLTTPKPEYRGERFLLSADSKAKDVVQVANAMAAVNQQVLRRLTRDDLLSTR